jgi:hypothetical protein
MVRGDSAQSLVDMHKVDYKVVALYMSQKKTGGRGEGDDFMSKGSYCGTIQVPSFCDQIAMLL